jgi:type IV pilus assembly protein PilW
VSARGFSLVELMVAVALGWVVIGGALALHQTVSRSSHQAAALSELNDAARFALAYIETDLRLAGFLGLAADPATVDGVAAAADPVAIGVRGDCGRNWAVNLAAPVGGFNNRYGLACPPWRGARAGSDVLVVRRAAGRTTVPQPARLQIHTGLAGGALATDGLVPAGLTPPLETRDLVADAYYVSRSSSAGAGVPGLRRKTLQRGPRVVDEELMPGVEDLQIQFGLDLDPPGTEGRGSIDLWVNPEDPRLEGPDARIGAARVWLLVAAPDPRRAARSPVPPYADRPAPPPGDARRLLVARNYTLRNVVERKP